MLWINGNEAEQISALDRGLAYGDGLFETMRVVGGRLPLWRRHRARLLSGLECLGIPIDADKLDAEVGRAAHRYGDGVLKLVVTRGKGGKGYTPPAPEQLQPSRIIIGRPLDEDPRKSDAGIDAIVCRTVLGNHPQLAGMKHLNRLEQVLAAGEVAERGADEGLMRDAGGCVVEGTRSNLFIVSKGQLLTPPVRGGVAGVMRAVIIELAHELDLDCNEVALQVEDVLAADEAFVCNSVFGIWPLRSLEQQALRSGTMTQRLQQRIESLFAE